MLIMESYMCYCSVRLGVITVAIMAMIHNFTLSMLFFYYGIEFMDPVLDIIQSDEQYRNSAFIKMAVSFREHYPKNVLIYAQLRLFLHFISALFGIYGAVRLKKWFVLPLAFFEFLFFIEMFSFHIVLMIVLKKLINLGVLITLTLAGSFYVLLLGYNCATCLALFQIITLVKSERYRALYGEDPFHPLLTNWEEKAASLGYNTRGTLENVRVLVTPNEHDIDEQKRLAKLDAGWLKPQLKATSPKIISVLPVNNSNNYANPLQRAQPSKWWQQHDFGAASDDEDAASYRNWQHTELIGNDVKRKNALNNQYWQRH